MKMRAVLTSAASVPATTPLIIRQIASSEHTWVRESGYFTQPAPLNNIRDEISAHVFGSTLVNSANMPPSPRVIQIYLSYLHAFLVF